MDKFLTAAIEEADAGLKEGGIPICSGTILLYGIPHIVIAEDINFMGKKSFLNREA